MEGRSLRDRDAIALDLVGVLGLSAFLLGLNLLQGSEELGFDFAGAFEGIMGQLAVTLPAALLVLGATVLELAAGLVLARSVRREPFDSMPEAVLAAFAAAVVKDTFLLGTLAAVGLFVAPVLLAIDLAIVVAGLWLRPVARHVVPLTTFRRWRDGLASVPSWPIAALVAVVWAGPVLLQLASPVVPFIDVLPNYVAPAEHLRTFGWFEPLTATQSPIHGPSRSVLGYDGLLGSLAAMTSLPGGLAIAGFILPLTAVLAAGAHRLAGAIRGGDPPAGAWALLAFALSQPFARLADARGTVVVVPLVCLGLAVVAELLHATGDATRDGRRPSPWRIGRGPVIGIALGMATLVHPVIGAFAIATVAIVGLLRPDDLAVDAFVATLTGGLLALPQLATMISLSLPTLALGVWLPLVIALGIGANRLAEARPGIADAIVRLARVGRIVLAAALAVGIVGAFAISILNLDRVPAAAEAGLDLMLQSSGILLATLAVGILAGTTGARSPIVLVGLAVGVVAVLLTQVLPSNLGLLGDALRFELPKTVHYWLSGIAAAGAGAALAAIWGSGRLPLPARAGAIALFVAAAAYPLRVEPIDSYHLGEHRWSETFAIDLHYAETGFWIGFPDRRTVVDAPRREILEAVRAEIDAGRLRHDTPVLHVASSFQQWVATPLGVFDGVTETFVSKDPEHSLHTVGGRLFGFEELPGFLASGLYPYVVVEPRDLPAGVAEQVPAASYTPLFSNGQGTVYQLGR